MEFEKPKTEYITVKLQKDLHGKDEICPTCNGIGLMIAPNIYGIDGDPNKSTLFPYKRESLTFCNTCYNGVVHRCEFCGEIIPRMRTKCTCEKQKEIDRLELKRKTQEEFENAPLATKEIADSYECFYSEYCSSNNGYFFDWEDFFDTFSCDYPDLPKEDRPKYVWVTDEVKIKLDAGSIIEQATEDLYEDAIYDISSEKEKELQNFLDAWAETCGVGKTYFESHKYKVAIPWEQYDE